MDNEDDVLYGDLELSGQAAEILQLKEKLNSANNKIATLSLELDDAHTQIQLLLDEKAVTERNAITVYNTALREISRKDSVIDELKKKIIEMEISKSS